jgi:hypothetical protein
MSAEYEEAVFVIYHRRTKKMAAVLLAYKSPMTA